MTKVITMPKPKKEQAHNMAAHILRQHKDKLVEVVSSEDANKHDAVLELNKQYKRAIAMLQQQYPKYIHGGHYQAFETDTAELMHGYMMQSAWTHARKYAVAVLVLLLIIAAMVGLWNL